MTFSSWEEKAGCLAARDAYWACLDLVKKDKGDADIRDCPELRERYTTACPGHWVRHFDKKKSYLMFKETLSNYQTVNKSPLQSRSPLQLNNYENIQSENSSSEHTNCRQLTKYENMQSENTSKELTKYVDNDQIYRGKREVLQTSRDCQRENESQNASDKKRICRVFKGSYRLIHYPDA